MLMISSLSLLISIPTFQILLHWILFFRIIYISLYVHLFGQHQQKKEKKFKTRQMEAQKIMIYECELNLCTDVRNIFAFFFFFPISN